MKSKKRANGKGSAIYLGKIAILLYLSSFIYNA